MDIKKQITVLSKARQALLDAVDAIEDVEKHDEKYEEFTPKIDGYERDITDLMKQNFDGLEFEFVLDQLSCLGACPNVLNDDNGHWAVTADGYQNVVTGDPKDVETSFFVRAEDWRNTPREALKHFMEDDGESDEEEPTDVSTN